MRFVVVTQWTVGHFQFIARVFSGWETARAALMHRQVLITGYSLRCFSGAIARNFMDLAVRIVSSRTDILETPDIPSPSIDLRSSYCRP